MRILAAAAAFALAACATTPMADERAMAEDVFRLSGGLEDLRLMAQFAPMAVDTADIKRRCEDSAGRNALARAACGMLDDALAGLRDGGAGAGQMLDAQITRLESRAVDAMVETYTPGELAAMRRYYASTEGRSIVAKRSEFFARLFTGS